MIFQINQIKSKGEKTSPLAHTFSKSSKDDYDTINYAYATSIIRSGTHLSLITNRPFYHQTLSLK